MVVLFIVFYLLLTLLIWVVERFANRIVGQLYPVSHWIGRLFFCTTIVVAIAWVMGSMLFIFFNHWTAQSLISSLIIITLLNLIGKIIFIVLACPILLIKSAKTKKTIFVLTVLLVLVFAEHGLKGVYNAHHPVVKSVEIEFADLPESFDGYKIVFLSDIHYGVFGSYSDLMKRTQSEIERVRPDLLIVGGDWVSTMPQEITPARPFLRKLYAQDGKFGVMGNHDYMTYHHQASPEERRKDSLILKKQVRLMGFSWLDDAHTVLRRGNDSIVIAGVENWGEGRFGQKGNIDRALAGVSDSAFVVLASHNPEHFRQIIHQKYPVALTLSGHTHAMQCVLTLGSKRYSPASWFYPLWGGLYDFGAQKLFISEGLGCSLYAFRVGTQAEIAEITLRRRP